MNYHILYILYYRGKYHTRWYTNHMGLYGIAILFNDCWICWHSK